MVEVICHVAVQSEITGGFGKITVFLSSPFRLAEQEQSDDTLPSSYPPLGVGNAGEFLHHLCVLSRTARINLD